jgi:subtilisin-like proprotein convertase family protein
VVLDSLTEYFWRVTPDNICGSGEASAASSFTTANLICITPDLTIGVDDPGVESSASLLASGTITDLDVSIEAPHSWVGDLIFTLTHDDTGTSAVIIDQPGFPDLDPQFGCSGDDIDVLLDDEAALPVEDECSNLPAIAGTFSPNNPLSVFDGESLSGTWTLNVVDRFPDADDGTVVEWCLIPSTQGAIEDTDGDGVADDVDNCTLTVNPDQRDTNGDGFGNACDADLNDDCVVNFVDLGLLRSVFFTADADADFNGDGTVNFVDLGLMRLSFFGPPGPAVEPNACSAAN